MYADVRLADDECNFGLDSVQFGKNCSELLRRIQETTAPDPRGIAGSY